MYRPLLIGNNKTKHPDVYGAIPAEGKAEVNKYHSPIEGINFERPRNLQHNTPTVAIQRLRIKKNKCFERVISRLESTFYIRLPDRRKYLYFICSGRRNPTNRTKNLTRNIMKHLMINFIIEMPNDYATIYANVIGNYYQSVHEFKSIREWRKIPHNAISVNPLPLNKQWGFLELPADETHKSEQFSQYNN